MKHDREFWTAFAFILLVPIGMVAGGAGLIIALVWATRHFEYTPIVAVLLAAYGLAHGCARANRRYNRHFQ